MRVPLLAVLLLAPCAGASGTFAEASLDRSEIHPGGGQMFLDARVGATKAHAGMGTGAMSIAERTVPLPGVRFVGADERRIADSNASLGRSGALDTRDPETLKAHARVRSPDELPVEVVLPVIGLDTDVDARKMARKASKLVIEAVSSLSAPIGALALAPARASVPERLVDVPVLAPPPRFEIDRPPAGAWIRASSAGPVTASGPIDAPPHDPTRELWLVASMCALLLLPLALSARLRGPRLLAQETRAKLAVLLAERPGSTAAALARELGIDGTTARYHLRQLAREGLATRRGGLWAAPGVAVAEPPISPRVMEAVRANAGARKVDLMRILQMPRATLSWHLGRLSRAGLVRMERRGSHVRVHPATAN